MKYYLISLLMMVIAGCSTQGNVSNTAYQDMTVDQKISSCLACHGADGKSGKAGVPPLGGRPYPELVTAMEVIREGYFPQPILGHQLSDKDIHEIAVYFASIPK